MIDALFGRGQTPSISRCSRAPSYILAALLLIAVIGLVVMVWFNPFVVDEVDDSQVDVLQLEIERQAKVINGLEAERSEQLQLIARLERMSQVDRESVSRVQDELKSYQDERLKMEERLVFLRNIVASKSGNKGLHLQRLRLYPGKSENSFLYTFTISKLLRDKKYLEGQVQLSLVGEQDGVKRTLPLRVVTKEKLDGLKMRFKHFQNLEGEFLLPGGFKPTGVTIEIKPQDKKFAPVKKSFEWVVIG